MRRKLGEILQEKGAVSRADLDAVLSDQSAGEPAWLGDRLVSLGKVSPVQLAEALSVQHGLPFVDLPSIAPEVLAELPRSFQAAHRMVPFALQGTNLSVAVANPSDADGMAEVKKTPGRVVTLFVAAGDEIDALVAPGMGTRPSSAADSGALSADDLFSNLALDTQSGVRAPPASAAAAPAPPPSIKPKASPKPPPVAARPSPKAAPGARPSPAAPKAKVEPPKPPEGAKRPEAPLAQLEQAPAKADAKPPSSAPPALALPDWLKTSGGAVAPVAPKPAPAGEPGAWTGALDSVAPSKLVTAAVRALVKKGLLTEAELLAELASKE